MKRSMLAGAVALALLGASSMSFAVEVGDTPAFNVKSSSGQPLSLEKYKGKIIVVDFWATWCGPCMHEAQHMVDINKQYADQGMQFIGISLDDDQAKMKSVAATSGFTWPQFYDGGGWENKLAVEWGIKSIPATFIIDPMGKVVWKGHPANIDAALAKAFKDSPPLLVTAEVASAAKAALDSIDQSIDTDPLGAITTLGKVPAEAKKDPAIAARIDAAATKINAAAEHVFTDAEVLIADKKYGAGIEKLRALVTAMPKSPVADRSQKRIDEVTALPEAKAEAELAMMNAKANEVLKNAQTFRSQKKDTQAYFAFKIVVRDYPKSDAAKPARDAIAAYETDPKFAIRAADEAAGSDAKSLLSLAQNYKAAGKLDLARMKFQAVVDSYPGTSFAATAKQELASLP